MVMKPLGDRIVIRQHDNPEKTVGGIFLPETLKDRPGEGTVVAVGPGKHVDGEFKATVLKAGDVVMYSEWSGKPAKIGGEEFFIMEESEIIGRLVEE